MSSNRISNPNLALARDLDRSRFCKIILSGPLFLIFVSLAFAIIPADLRESDPLSQALYHAETFQSEESIVPNTPEEARTKLLALIQSQPENSYLYKALSDIEVELMDVAQAEIHIKQFVEKSQDKDSSYYALEDFYHKRLRFEDEYKEILNHAAALKAEDSDPEIKTGPYSQYHRALSHREKYGLADDPESVYKTIVERYPKSERALLDWIEFRSNNTDTAKPLELLELFHQKFPEEQSTYLLKKSQLLEASAAFDLLDSSYDPLWDVDLAKALDSAAVRADKKGSYLESLKQRLGKNPLDIDAVTRLFHSYYLAGNAIESNAVLNDFRLLKDKNVREKKSRWELDELWIMARLHQRALNLNEAARFYFALYGAQQKGGHGGPPSKETPDDALHGLFEIILTAEERPIQIGAGNLDFYKDIATVDSSPGVFNGILSLILNGQDLKSGFQEQESKGLGYFNRSQAAAILRIIQRDYPSSKHLPGMYRNLLKIYLKYGMDDLIIKTGEEFFQAFPNSDQLMEVGIEVVDAYARKKDNNNEWRTYEYLLLTAAKNSNQLFPTSQTPTSDSDEYEQDEAGEEYESQPATQSAPVLDYESILKRYITSLTREKNYLGVLKLYLSQIEQHPAEETLYTNFSDYLSQSNLFNDEAEIYKRAIRQFKTRSWYEKLARWYIRREQTAEFEKISKEIVDLFQGTEVAQYISSVPYTTPYRSLEIALNKYALVRFPYNLTFVKNLLAIYSTPATENWDEWERLCRKYYFLDDSIRERYLYRLAQENLFDGIENPKTNPEKFFTADKLVWKSHYEESIPYYQELASKFTSDQWINIRLADLKRSAAWQNPDFYNESAQLREHLAKINPSDVSLWTTAGETVADIENYEAAKQYWENIVQSDPHNPDRYLEVATILWDYYLFDDALNLIQRARKISNTDSLYAYEAGAIYESKRNYEAAVAEYSKSLVSGSDNARNRLTELYRRPRLTPLIRTHLEKQLNENPQNGNLWTGVIDFYSSQQEKNTVNQYISRAIDTLQKQSFENASASLMNSAKEFGFDSLQVKILQKQIQYAPTDLQRLTINIELANFYDAHGDKNSADAILAGLYKKQPSSAGLIQDLSQFYWRNENYDKAFEIYNSAISISNANFKKRFLREVADRYRERKMYDRALAAAAELQKDDPLNSDLFQFVSEIYAEQNNYKALAEHYRAGLQLVRDSQMPEDQKKQQIALMRRGIIQANLILKDYTAAIDQYIELLNRDAENEALVREASEFAARHELTPRLIEYYQKTAASSPKDHRWPMMLGRIYLYSARPADAIQSFLAAVAIRPERVDLHQSLEDAYQRAGQYKEALQVLDRIYALTYKDPQWLASMAELQVRMGNQKKALELYEQYLASRTPLERDFEMTQKALSWGMPRSAIAYGKAGMQKYRTDLKQWIPSEGFSSYMEALVQTNSASEALQIMHQTLSQIDVARKNATFDDQALSSIQYMVQDNFTRAFPLLIRKYLTATDLNSFEAAVLSSAATATSQQKSERFLPLVRASGLARAEERLLMDLLNEFYRSNRDKYRSYRSQLQQFYLDRHAYAACGDFLNKEWQNRSSRYYYNSDLVEIAEAYRMAHLIDKELAALRQYYAGRDLKTGSSDPEAVERYLALLYEKKLRDELRKTAANPIDFVPANYFMKQKDAELALIAITSLSRGEDPVWQTIQSAMVGKELTINEPKYGELFKTALDLRTIGDQLTTRGDEQHSAFGDDWFYYGNHYGEYLWNIGEKSQASYFLVSDIEGAPVRSQFQDDLGSYYLDKVNFAEGALQHFTLASELEPANIYYQDHRAHAFITLGKKDEAVSIWKSLIKPPSSDRYLLLLRAASKYGFLQDVNKDIESYLSEQIEKYGALQINLIEEYLDAIPDEQRQAFITKWIGSAPAPKEFAEALLRLDLENAERISVLKQTSMYLKNRMRSAAGQEVELSRNQWASWNLKAAKEYLEMQDPKLAESVVTEVLEEFNTTKAEDPYSDEFILLHAKILVQSQNNAEALEVLQKFARGSFEKQPQTETTVPNEDKFRKAAEVFENEGRQSEANLLLAELYERQLLSGSTEPSVYVGLAEIHLEENRPGDAKELLNRMLYGSKEDLERFNISANVFEKHNRLEEAVALRQELARRKPWNITNRAMLSKNYLALSKNKEAAAEAKRILELSQASVEDQIRAAQVFGTASTLSVGSVEMQEIEKVMRKQKPTTQLNPYSTALRHVLFERDSVPDLKILLSEVYMNPKDVTLKVPLFEAYQRAGLCENALDVIDPDKVSYSSYSGEENGYSDDEYSEYDRYDPTENYPVNNLNLTDEESSRIAMEAAECAGMLGRLQSQIFFLNVAASHEYDDAKYSAITKTISELETKAAAESTSEAERWKIGANLGRES